jgi:lysophospholipase L1-like esterase
MKKRPVLIAVYLFSCALLFLALSEVSLRILFARTLRQDIPLEALPSFDPVLGWRIAPFTREIRVWQPSGRVVDNRFNARGMRGAVYPYERQQPSCRILVLGDSLAEGWHVSDEDIFSELLRRDLSGSSPVPVEVINAAVRGYSTDQELIYFRTEGKRYSPDLTVLMVTDNDIWYNTRKIFFDTPKPVFPLDADGRLQQSIPPEMLPVPADRAASAKVRAAEWLRHHSYLYMSVRQVLQHYHPLHAAAIRIGLIKPRVSPTDHFFDPQGVPYFSWLTVYRAHEDEDMASAWRATGALLKELRDETARAGGKLLVVYVPDEYVLKPVWEKMRVRHPSLFGPYAPGKVSSRLGELCALEGIPFLSILEPVLAHSRSELYFRNHLTEKGNRVLAESLSGYIITTHLCGTSSGK